MSEEVVSQAANGRDRSEDSGWLHPTGMCFAGRSAVGYTSPVVFNTQQSVN